MSPVGGILIILGLIAAGTAIWFITPVWQCPVCHSYKVAEHEIDGEQWLECENEQCRHGWRAV